MFASIRYKVRCQTAGNFRTSSYDDVSSHIFVEIMVLLIQSLTEKTKILLQHLVSQVLTFRTPSGVDET